ncbi:MAG: amidohydrolase [Bacteroidetes bacterium]|nr:amidohydrolase [Bacteroidota bacterium]
MLKDKVQSLAAKYFRKAVAIRRHIHAHPELSFQEKKTSQYISSVFKESGIPHKKGIAGTGIVALVKGKKISPEPPVIALRADMDALPIPEQNNVPYISKNKGVMHACGHDVHAASLLVVGIILNDIRDRFAGAVKLIFQPGEEKLPGGASLMIKGGVLTNPAPRVIVAQHVFPFLETGKAGFRAGKYMASCDEIYITVKGRGGHAALPKHTVNPILIASEIICKLNYDFMVPSTATIPEIPTVLSFGKIIAEGATNVIPSSVNLEGTLRTMDEAWREEAHLRIKNIAGEIAAKHSGSCDINILKGYPFLINDEKLTARLKQYAVEYLGRENVVDLEPMMTSEDFSFYSQEIPACFYRLGVRNESKGIISPVHSPTFDIDEDALKTAIGLMAWMALRELET